MFGTRDQRPADIDTNMYRERDLPAVLLGHGGRMRHAVLALLLVAGCADPAAKPYGTPLPLGKSDLRLDAGAWASPEGFAPRLVLRLADGWQSVHRYADFFDVGYPEPGQDVPRLAVAFSRAE